jgi:hypothetical protein
MFPGFPSKHLIVDMGHADLLDPLPRSLAESSVAVGHIRAQLGEPWPESLSLRYRAHRFGDDDPLAPRDHQKAVPCEPLKGPSISEVIQPP